MGVNTLTNQSNNYLIDISGLCDPSNITTVISEYPYWKQMHITETLEIPEVKPDIEQINSISIAVTTIKQKVIKTPRTYDDSGIISIPEPNLEGKLLTGRKLIIEGQLCQQIEYTADEPEQSVHSVHFYVPFSAFIIVPLEVTINTQSGSKTVDSADVKFDVSGCVEDLSACIIDERTILKQVTLLMSAVPQYSC